jgi:hypothetical protein
LIPFLKEKVISVLAKRGDIEDQTIYAISVYCDANGAEELARNTIIFIDEKTVRKLISRFDDNIAVMNMLAKRLDLTQEVLDEILKILSALRRGSSNVGKIASTHMEGVKVNVRGADIICAQLENSSPQQIHSIAIDFRQKRVVNYIEVIEITQRTNINFLVSILALEARQTLVSVRDALSLRDTKAFINLLKAAGVDMKYGPRLMDIVKRYSHSLDE